MKTASLVILVIGSFGQSPAARDDAASREPSSSRSKRERLMELYTGEAADYTIHRDGGGKEKLVLRREPVYFWRNQVRNGEQDGAVFVWTYRGRAEVIGTFFSYPPTGTRELCHEFHSLSLSVLDVTRSSRENRWTPRAPGIQLAPVEGAPKPAPSSPQRVAQMRAIAREFSAETRDDEEKHWDLRLLPQPLYRYESTDPDVLDGAVFAFVTSAGTDPEVILVVEARKPARDPEPVWQYAVGRFTDLNLSVRHKATVVFTGQRIPFGGIDQDGNYRYHVFRDRYIPAIQEKAR
jgi:hypothetical protein